MSIFFKWDRTKKGKSWLQCVDVSSKFNRFHQPFTSLSQVYSALEIDDDSSKGKLSNRFDLHNLLLAKNGCPHLQHTSFLDSASNKTGSKHWKQQRHPNLISLGPSCVAWSWYQRFEMSHRTEIEGLDPEQSHEWCMFQFDAIILGFILEDSTKTSKSAK